MDCGCGGCSCAEHRHGTLLFLIMISCSFCEVTHRPVVVVVIVVVEVKALACLVALLHDTARATMSRALLNASSLALVQT